MGNRSEMRDVADALEPHAPQPGRKVRREAQSLQRQGREDCIDSATGDEGLVGAIARDRMGGAQGGADDAPASYAGAFEPRD